MIECGEILTLSDNKVYSVVFTTKYNNEDYIYLIDQDDYTNTMFCKYIDNELEEVTDSNIVEELLKLFVANKNN